MNTQPFESIQPLQGTLFGEAAERAQGRGAEHGILFADIFQSAIDNVKTTDAELNQAEYLLATGQLDNPAQQTMAATKAQAAVELLIQLRNKALEAYNEVNRISL